MFLSTRGPVTISDRLGTTIKRILAQHATRVGVSILIEVGHEAVAVATAVSEISFLSADLPTAYR